MRLCAELPPSPVIYLKPATFSSQLLMLCDILVMALASLLKREKLDVRHVMLETSHGRFCKHIQKEVGGDY